VQLNPYNRIRLMKIPILQVTAFWACRQLASACFPCVRGMLSQHATAYQLVGWSLGGLACPLACLLRWASLSALFRCRCTTIKANKAIVVEPQAFLTKLFTKDLPGLITLPKRLEINIPPAVTAGEQPRLARRLNAAALPSADVA
jgi:hypothetical protein